MNCSEMGSDDWWVNVESMPFDEALQILHSYKSTLLEETSGTSEYIEASKKLHRVNAEIKRLNIIRVNDVWRKACKNVLPPELFEAVVTEEARLRWTDQ